MCVYVYVCVCVCVVCGHAYRQLLTFCAVSLLWPFVVFQQFNSNYLYTGLSLAGRHEVATAHALLYYLFSWAPWVLFCATKGKPDSTHSLSHTYTHLHTHTHTHTHTQTDTQLLGLQQDIPALHVSGVR